MFAARRPREARTCAAVEATFRPDANTAAVEISARRKLKECDAKLVSHRHALEAGTDPTIVSGWIEEVKLERKKRSSNFDASGATAA